MDNYVVVVEGLSALEDIQSLPDAILRKARMAINKTAERVTASSRRSIRDQIAFPARYLTDPSKGLTLAKASGKTLAATIKGRERPTSLARFVRDRNPTAARNRGGVRVEVKPGSPKFMKGAFLMKLKKGSASIDTAYNLGLAIRLKPGESVRNKKYSVEVSKGLYLLYGPSVNQAFRDVAEKAAPEAIDYLEREFLRLMEL